MPKRLVVCCDGTWNRPDQLDDGVAAPTNVYQLAIAVAREDERGVEQVLHYQVGVGTRRFERLRGGGLGIGLSRNVQDCYRLLVDHYEPGDELFLFGFSRGAYTARSLGGFVGNCGILRPQHRDRVGEAYRLYRSRDDVTRPSGREAQVFRRMYSHPDAEVAFIGVWDTVGALGIPISGFRPPLVSKLWMFHDTNLSRRVRRAYQAVAIDERRGAFEPTLWNKCPDAGPDQVLEQVWFTGAHCDVGGGHCEPELSEIALLWMAEKARAAGLAFEPDRLKLTEPPRDARLPSGERVWPDALGTIHDSLGRLYRLLPHGDRRLAGVDGGKVASSAARRHREDSTYRPAGLTELLQANETALVEDGAR